MLPICDTVIMYALEAIVVLKDADSLGMGFHSIPRRLMVLWKRSWKTACKGHDHMVHWIWMKEELHIWRKLIPQCGVNSGLFSTVKQRLLTECTIIDSPITFLILKITFK